MHPSSFKGDCTALKALDPSAPAVGPQDVHRLLASHQDILATTRLILARDVVTYNNGYDALENAHFSSCESKMTTLSLISLQSAKEAKIMIRNHGRLHFMEYLTLFNAVPLVTL